MFVSFNPDWPPPQEPVPPPKPRRLSRNDEKRLFQAIAFNAVLLLVAPIGGATLFAAIWAPLGG